MRLHPRTGYGALPLAAALLSACADGIPVAPEAAPTNSVAATTTAPVCQTIDFNQFAHGDPIGSVSLDGMTINFAVASYVQPDGAANPNNNLLAFDTDVDPDDGWLDTDLTYLNDGYCDECNGLNTLLVIEDERGFTYHGDYRWGGLITLTGFGADTYIQSFTVADNNLGEPAVVMQVDGVTTATSTPQGEGDVEVVTASSTPVITSSVTFSSGSVAADRSNGSFGLDDIVVCTKTEELGDDGCTPGYWKNHEDSWDATGYSLDQTLESVFDVPDAYNLDGVTLHAALSLKGGPTAADAAGLLLHHAVAALLNASHPDVDYPRSAAAIIADVNAALATGSRSAMLTLKSALDADNNLGCPIN